MTLGDALQYLRLFENKKQKEHEHKKSVRKQKRHVKAYFKNKSMNAKKCTKATTAQLKKKKSLTNGPNMSFGPVFIVASFHLTYFIDYYLETNHKLV